MGSRWFTCARPIEVIEMTLRNRISRYQRRPVYVGDEPVLGAIDQRAIHDFGVLARSISGQVSATFDTDEWFETAGKVIREWEQRQLDHKFGEGKWSLERPLPWWTLIGEGVAGG